MVLKMATRQRNHAAAEKDNATHHATKPIGPEKLYIPVLVRINFYAKLSIVVMCISFLSSVYLICCNITGHSTDKPHPKRQYQVPARTSWQTPSRPMGYL